jgi:hypothetical protein
LLRTLFAEEHLLQNTLNHGTDIRRGADRPKTGSGAKGFSTLWNKTKAGTEGDWVDWRIADQGETGELATRVEMEDGGWDGNLIVGEGIHLEKGKKPCRRSRDAGEVDCRTRQELEVEL